MHERQWEAAGPDLRMPRPGRARAGSTGQPCSPLYEPHSRCVERRGVRQFARTNDQVEAVAANGARPMSAGPRNAGMADSQVRPVKMLEEGRPRNGARRRVAPGR